MNKSFAILGMGSFGKYMTNALYESGASVMIADRSAETIAQFADKCTVAMTADLSDPEAIRGLGIENVDVVIVSMSQNLEPSIMCTMVAKELGVPYIISKASNKRMEEILLKVGADEVINIEEDAAFRTSKRLLSDDFIDYLDFDDNLCLIEVRPKAEWVGKTLRDLRLRERYDINVVAVREEGDISAHIDPKLPLKKNSQLTIILQKKDLEKLDF